MECYKKAHLSRKLFSRIRTEKGYHPSKPTVLALGIALELPLHEFKKFLETAGYALTHSSYQDIIVEFFIKKGIYNLDTINQALYQFNQKGLGEWRQVERQR